MSKELWENVKRIKEEYLLLLGPYFAHQILKEPRHFLFSLSRYKFAARMLPRGNTVTLLELGCNEGIGTIFLSEHIKDVVAVDFDSAAIEYAKKHLKDTNITFIDSNFLNMNFGLFDAIVSLDVIEHVDKSDKDAFFKTIITNLKDHGVCIIGTPNENSSQHASESSKKGHVNLFTAERLYNTLSQYFHNVFLFGMNDEVVHTGFYPMCHYLLAIGCGIRNR